MRDQADRYDYQPMLGEDVTPSDLAVLAANEICVTGRGGGIIAIFSIFIVIDRGDGPQSNPNEYEDSGTKEVDCKQACCDTGPPWSCNYCFFSHSRSL